MFYDFALTLPANTLESSPEEQEIELTEGVITHVEVEFPPGCAGLAYAAIDRFEHQVWPTNPDGNFNSDGGVIIWNDYYELFDRPFTIKLRGWSPGTVYAHDITFRFEITPREIAERGVKEIGLLGKFLRLVGIK